MVRWVYPEVLVVFVLVSAGPVVGIAFPCERSARIA